MLYFTQMWWCMLHAEIIHAALWGLPQGPPARKNAIKQSWRSARHGLELRDRLGRGCHWAVPLVRAKCSRATQQRSQVETGSTWSMGWGGTKKIRTGLWSPSHRIQLSALGPSRLKGLSMAPCPSTPVSPGLSAFRARITLVCLLQSKNYGCILNSRVMSLHWGKRSLKYYYYYWRRHRHHHHHCHSQYICTTVPTITIINIPIATANSSNNKDGNNDLILRRRGMKPVTYTVLRCDMGCRGTRRRVQANSRLMIDAWRQKPSERTC
jgi:hypothetical protein